MELGLNTAIRVYQITKSILFSGFPFEDCKDRLALVTVAAGLRKAAVFDSPELVVGTAKMDPILAADGHHVRRG